MWPWRKRRGRHRSQAMHEAPPHRIPPGRAFVHGRQCRCALCGYTQVINTTSLIRPFTEVIPLSHKDYFSTTPLLR